MDNEPSAHQSFFRTSSCPQIHVISPIWELSLSYIKSGGSLCDPCKVLTVYIIDAIEIITELSAFCVIVGRGYHK
jgi:hypothetical protein